MNKLEKSQFLELANLVEGLALDLEDLLKGNPEHIKLQEYAHNCAVHAQNLERKLREEIEHA